jgi:predicted TIM-barrel fold metal-dependent hydrolase
MRRIGAVDTPIIDYHAHIERDVSTKNYLSDRLLEDMRENGISFRLTSAIDGTSIDAQNNFIGSFAGEYPEIIGCGIVNPKEDSSVSTAERLASMDTIRAMEMDPLEHGYLPERCPNIDAILDIARERDMPVNVFTGWGVRTAPHQWAYWARRHPRVTFVLLHMGGIDFGYSCVDLVKEFDNMMVETSGQTEMPILNIAFRTLGPERFLFGSHYPDKFTKISLMIFEYLHLTEEYKKMLFYENAKRILKL